MGRKPKRRSEEWAPPLLVEPDAEAGEDTEEASPLSGLEPDALREALQALTVKELRAQAKAWDVGLKGKSRKADLIELLVKARGGTKPTAPARPPQLSG